MVMFQCKGSSVLIGINWIIRRIKRKGWKAGMFKTIVTETLYGIWMYKNSKIFEIDKGYSDTSTVIKSIIDVIVYKEWMKPKFRNHLASILL